MLKVRVLFVVLPGVGHVRPMTPTARAVRRAGHEVLFATGRDFLGHVAAAGFPAEPAGPTRTEARDERLRRYPESGTVRPTEQQRFHVLRVWAGIYAPIMLRDLLPLIARWRPDLIVYDMLALAAPLAAAVSGVPAVSHSTGPGFAHDLLDEAGEWVAPLWREHGRPVPAAAGAYGRAHLDVWPAALQLPDVWPATPQPPDVRLSDVQLPDPGERPDLLPVTSEDDEPAGEAPLPDWFADLPYPHSVHVTLGTVFNHNLDAFRAVVAALRDRPVNLLVTVGPDGDPAELGEQPEHVRVTRWLPHRALLPACALVVCHGGGGTTLKSLRHGVPLLLLPQGADEFRTARACERVGVARHLDPDSVDPDRVRDQFNLLWTDSGYRQNCGILRKEIDQMPSPDEVVPALEELAAR
jgi:UDP:flavonoid glycosyltransferase YjiC (YdhE family)